jgi:hypothetical protein
MKSGVSGSSGHVLNDQHGRLFGVVVSLPDHAWLPAPERDHVARSPVRYRALERGWLGRRTVDRLEPEQKPCHPILRFTWARVARAASGWSTPSAPRGSSDLWRPELASCGGPNLHHWSNGQLRRGAGPASMIGFDKSITPSEESRRLGASTWVCCPTRRHHAVRSPFGAVMSQRSSTSAIQRVEHSPCRARFAPGGSPGRPGSLWTRTRGQSRRWRR